MIPPIVVEDEDEGGHQYSTTSFYEKLVADYTGLNFLQIDDLNYIDYLRYRRDAFIHKLSQTEKGNEMLDTAWYLEQTKPDRKKLREKCGKEVTD